MNQPPDPQGRRADGEGATTASKGTPVAVDVATSRQTKVTLAVFLSGPLIWSAHFMLVYLVVEAGCTGGGPGLGLFDPPVPTVVTLVATAVAALACLATTAWGYRRWRTVRGGPTDPSDLTCPDQGGSLAFAGFLLSLLGFVAVLFTGLPALFLPACGP